MANELMLGTNYEDTETVARICRAEAEIRLDFEKFHREVMANFRRVAGMIYSSADLEKLHLEERPAFTYNLLLPIILHLAGNFISNQSKCEALPRTPGDHRLARIFTDTLDYTHYTANNLQRTLALMYISTIVGRVGWACHGWGTKKDPEGNVTVKHYNLFRLIYDNSFSSRDLSDCNFIIDRGWYTPEELLAKYGKDDDDLYDEIYAKSTLILGRDPKDRNRILNIADRISGLSERYSGRDSGYDEVTQSANDFLFNNWQYVDAHRGRLQVMEFHERRQERIFTLWNPWNDKTYDITKTIKADQSGNYDQHMLEALKQKFTVMGVGPKIERTVVEKIYQTPVCPAFNMKFFSEPYPVQNGNYIFTPMFCFDFGDEFFDWKGYVDHLIDPVAAFNLNENTMQTYLMKAALGETWVEHGALGEHADAFAVPQIGGFKYVEKDAIRMNRIQRQQLPHLPPGHVQSNLMKKELVREISGVRDNSTGGAESKSESGRLFDSRVAQTDIMQNWPQENAMETMRMITYNTKDYLKFYMTPERLIRIVADETNPFWYEINKDVILKIAMNQESEQMEIVEEVKGSLWDTDFDIAIAKAPFGEAGKQREFEQVMIISDKLASLNPALVNPELLVKASTLRTKEEWIAHIKNVMGEQGLMAQQKQLQDHLMQKQNQEQHDMKMKQEGLNVKDKENDLMVDEAAKEVFSEVLTG